MKHSHPGCSDAQISYSADQVHGAASVAGSLERSPDSTKVTETTIQRDERLVRLAKCIHAIRRSRASRFEPELFGEASWDILLSLYVAAREQFRMKVATVCHGSGVPDTTALRWLDRLEQQGLVRRLRSSTDKRVWDVELTVRGLLDMDAMLLSALDEADTV